MMMSTCVVGKSISSILPLRTVITAHPIHPIRKPFAESRIDESLKYFLNRNARVSRNHIETSRCEIKPEYSVIAYSLLIGEKPIPDQLI
jgi:hypothetical protein